MLLIVTMQIFAYRTPVEVGALHAVDIVRTAAFAILVLVLAARSTSAFTLVRKDPTLDDELARANRANAARWGFWAMLAGCLAALVASLFVPLTAMDIIPFVLMAGAFVPAVRFSRAERKALEES